MEELTQVIHGSQNNKLFSRYFLHPEEKAKLLIVHGIGEHSGRYQNFAEEIYRYGYSIYLYDHRCHGLSEGKRGYIKNWNEYIEDLSSVCNHFNLPDPTTPSFIFGQSMGGLICLNFLSEFKPGFSAGVASAPALDNSTVSSVLLFILRMLNKISPGLVLNSPLNFAELSRDEQVVKDYKADPLVHMKITPRHVAEFLDAIDQTNAAIPDYKVPLLFTHGEDDGIVGIGGTLKYYNRLNPDVNKLITYPDGKHESHNDLHKKEAISNIIKWFNKHI